MRRSGKLEVTVLLAGMVFLLGAAVTVASNAGALPDRAVQPPAPIDPQMVRDQDDMTWDDYVPIPGTNWGDITQKGTSRQLRLAIVTADFEDQPFVMTLPKQSDIFGNPQADPVLRSAIPQFYADFYGKASALNKGHTIHEYWMEQSRGRVGISTTAFGPYRMPLRSFQYGNMSATDMPAGFDPSGNITRHLDSLWKSDRGDTIALRHDIVLRMYAGYDETAVWQEFGEMKFQTRDDITAAFGNPDTTKPRWVRSRYVPWTSWQAARWLWSNASIMQGEGINSIRHEISHFAFSIGDNYNNPYVTPYRRAPAGPWDLMDRGSFNGPGGPHRRWVLPPNEGGSMSAGLMLRQRLAFSFVDSAELLLLNRNGLARTGVAVARVTARSIAPDPGSMAGILIRLDGSPPRDRTPPDDPATNPLSSGIPNWNFYTMEVVQRMGYDSFTPDNGVLIAKNKDVASTVGGPNAFPSYTWVIDANPQDIGKVDFRRPNGEVVMRSIADYRQLNDALFHAGTNSGSAFEWQDSPNRLHFYVVDVERDARGVLSYTLAVRSLDGSGEHRRGVSLAPPGGPVAAGAADLRFVLANTGVAANIPADAHTTRNAGQFFRSDVFRLTVSVTGAGWTAALRNTLAAVAAGATSHVPVFVSASSQASDEAVLTLTARSESDTAVVASATYRLRR